MSGVLRQVNHQQWRWWGLVHMMIGEPMHPFQSPGADLVYIRRQTSRHTRMQPKSASEAEKKLVALTVIVYQHQQPPWKK